VTGRRLLTLGPAAAVGPAPAVSKRMSRSIFVAVGPCQIRQAGEWVDARQRNETPGGVSERRVGCFTSSCAGGTCRARF